MGKIAIFFTNVLPVCEILYAVLDGPVLGFIEWKALHHSHLQ